MNIENLRVFYKTVSHGSITAAANELYISQPAASLQIKALEKELQLVLIERSNKGVLPTQAGKIVYEYSSQILAQYESMIKEAHAINENRIQKLSVSSCATLGSYSLPCSIYEFRKKASNVEIVTEQTFSEEVISQVRDRGIDIGFIEGTYSDEAIECVHMGKTEMFLTGSPQLLPYNEVEPKKLYEFNYFVICKRCSLRKIIEENLIKAGIDTKRMNFSLESPSIESIKAFLIRGNGVSFLPYLSIKKEIYHKSLNILKIQGLEFIYNYSMIYRKKSANSIVKEFVEFMRNEGRSKLC
jgi:LysR family transcriptional regulator, transcriptional activator of the cysJI operon